MAETFTRPWNPVEHLKTQEDIVAYLEAALEDGDSELIAAALQDIARARGMTSTAQCSASAPPRRRFTVAEYYTMADIGILEENDRIELLGRRPDSYAAHRRLARRQRQQTYQFITASITGTRDRVRPESDTPER